MNRTASPIARTHPTNPGFRSTTPECGGAAVLVLTGELVVASELVVAVALELVVAAALLDSAALLVVVSTPEVVMVVDPRVVVVKECVSVTRPVGKIVVFELAAAAKELARELA